MSDAENLDIKKRARRRLVGAIALALLAAIILPMMMEQEPHPVSGDIQITIPDRDAAVGQRPNAAAEEPALAAAATPAPEEQAPPSVVEAPPPAPAKPESRAEVPAAGLPATGSPAVPATRPAAPKPEAPKPALARPAADEAAEAARARAAIEGREVPKAQASKGETFVLQIGAFGDAAKAARVAADLKKQGFAAYTEKAGNVTRVRVGPVTGRSATDKMAEQLRALGYSTVITPR
ncbi:SPOR domain-containing protein [Thauera sp.]|uniref:SPOR domain-containing protein n=1 Tax=Thauera sp. TaxID=1905334 RepID=UPI0039E57452